MKIRATQMLMHHRTDVTLLFMVLLLLVQCLVHSAHRRTPQVYRVRRSYMRQISLAWWFSLAH
jgi:hypothetical protein